MATPSTSAFPLTGDSYIDAATHGYMWVLDGSRTIKWAIADGFNREYWKFPLETASTLNTAFSTFSYYANIKFQYVGYYTNPLVAAQGGADITISMSQLGGLFRDFNTWAIGLFPNAANNYFYYPGAPGDIYLNISSQANYLSSYAPGSAGFFLAIHEIGHTLGLKHSHDNGGTGRPTLGQTGLESFDKDWFTIMSYADDYNWNLRTWDPATPMALDVLALQYLYGKNILTNAGDSRYTLPIDNQYQTIWDAGGNDWIDLSGSSKAWKVYLPEFQLSTLVDTKVGFAALASDTFLASPTTLYWLTGDIEHLRGSTYADVLTGNQLVNAISGNGGSDTLDGRGGNDVLDGGMGADTLIGGAGDDLLLVSDDAAYGAGASISNDGSPGTPAPVLSVSVSGKFYSLDNYNGGAGRDTMRLGDNANGIVLDVSGQAVPTISNVEVIDAGGSDDIVDLTSQRFSYGAVTLYGRDGNDVLWANVGNDVLDGGPGNDQIDGGAGNDTLVAGTGIDAIVGGLGNDLLKLPGVRPDYAVTRNANDMVFANSTGDRVSVRDIERVQFGNAMPIGMEIIIGSIATELDDVLVGAASDDTIRGMGGNDTIRGGDGNDALFGDAGIDQLIGGSGNDVLSGGTGDDRMEGGGGNDSFDADPATRSGADTMLGGLGNDIYAIFGDDVVVELLNEGIDTVIVEANYSIASLPDVERILAVSGDLAISLAGNDASNLILGNAGVNQLVGLGGNDILIGKDGNDTLDGGLGADRMEGDAGDDTYLVDRAANSVTGTAGDVVFEGTAAADSGGIDAVRTTLKNYTLTVNVENLIYIGEPGDFVGIGNNQYNLITGGVGNDLLKGGNGDDVLNGGAGNDTLDGGNGSDTVILAGNRTDYVFSRPDIGKVQVARKDGTETDLLAGMEQVKFADGSTGQLTLDDLLKNTASKLDDIYEGDSGANVFDGLAGNDSLLGGGDNDSLAGGLGNDTLDGGTGSDQLSGGLGNDVYLVDTAAVADPDPAKVIAGDVVSETLNAGIDKVQTSLAAYTLSANIEHLDYLGTPVAVLDAAGKPTGTSQVQQLAFAGTGNALANTITASTGNDTLDGGKGADRLIGGAGDDNYVVDRAAFGYIDAAGNSITIPGDQIIERDAAGADSGGTDTIQTSLATYSLASIAYVENLSYSGENVFRGTGNTLNNLISGGIANDVLTGGDGSDTLVGKNGNDLLKGGNGDDILNGGAGNDTLDGGNDSDTLLLSGNRADYVFSRPDVGKVQVTTKDGTETDLLIGIEQVKFADGSTGQLTLDDLLKNTASKFDDNYEGDKDANVFDSLAGNDSLLGGGGNDSLTGGLGNDTLDGGTGQDTLIGTKGDDVYVMDSTDEVVTENALEGTDSVRTGLADLTLAANVERLVYVGTGNFSGTGNELNNLVTGGSGNDSLGGGLGADTLQGADGDDTLDGGEGTDRLEGGAGDDTYVVTSPADLVRETDATGSDTGGNDTLRAQVAGRYVLAPNVENFAFDGADSVTASGNAGSNRISGGSGNDTLAGGAGNDILNGGAGADRLSGGLDSDVFVFDAAPASGFDTITDFRSGEDKIQLDHAIFDKLGSAGTLNAEYFVDGKTALDANDFLVYDKTTGILWYDADGSGDGAALQIALLSNKAVLAASDFSVG